MLEKDPIKTFRKLVKLKGVNGDDEKDEEQNSHVSRRNTVAALVKNKDKKRAVINDLDSAFAARMKKFRNGETGWYSIYLYKQDVFEYFGAPPELCF